MNSPKKKIVIVGAGFAGLNAAILLGRNRLSVTLIDKNNYHLFQPLLYQVATGFLAPGDIAGPIRSAVARYQTVRVIQAEVCDFDSAMKIVHTTNGSYPYDLLIVASGATHSYFGNDHWAAHAPGLKSIEDAIEIRSRVLKAFEDAERCNDQEARAKLLTFVVIGGGPTGVELAGALAELARGTLKGEFRNFDLRDVRILLVEGNGRLLSSMHESTSAYARTTLERLGVEVLNETMVVGIEGDALRVSTSGQEQQIGARTVVWAAGVQASGLAKALSRQTGATLDSSGRIAVGPDLSIPNYPEIFVLGDMALTKGRDGTALPGIAPVAIQQGGYIARLIIQRCAGKEGKPFRYLDKGMMAVIGRGRAVAESWKFRLKGFPAWVAWAFIHIYYLIEFQNKFVVFFHWAWNYLTNKRGSRLITR